GASFARLPWSPSVWSAGCQPRRGTGRRLVRQLGHGALVGRLAVSVRLAVRVAGDHQHLGPLAGRRLQVESDVGGHAAITRVADEESGTPGQARRGGLDVDRSRVEASATAHPEYDLVADRPRRDDAQPPPE